MRRHAGAAVALMADGGHRAPATEAGFDRRLGRKRHRRAATANIDLAVQLKENPAFATLSDTEIGAILDRTETRIYGLGDVILRHNGPGEGLFVLRQGKVRIVDESDPASPVNLVVLSPGAVFGERSLLFDAPVSATVRAVGRIVVQTLPIPAFRALVKERPEIAETMADTIRRYERYNFIRTVPNFAGLTTAEIEVLLNAAEDVALAAGAMFVAEGSTDDRFTVVREGELLVTATPPREVGPAAAADGAAETETAPPARLVGVLRATDTCGLQRVFDPAAVSAEIAANTDTRLFSWPSGLIRELAGSNSAFRETLATAARIEREQRETILAGADGDGCRRRRGRALRRQPAAHAPRAQRPEMVAVAPDRLPCGRQAARRARLPGRRGCLFRPHARPRRRGRGPARRTHRRYAGVAVAQGRRARPDQPAPEDFRRTHRAGNGTVRLRRPRRAVGAGDQRDAEAPDLCLARHRARWKPWCAPRPPNGGPARRCR